MNTAFQSNAFQRNAFQISSGGIPTPFDSGGIGYDGYKKKRKRLEEIARLSDIHLKSKYVHEKVEAAEIIAAIPVSVPEIIKAKSEDTLIDAKAYSAQLQRALSYLDYMIKMHEDMRKLQDDEDMLIILALA